MAASTIANTALRPIARHDVDGMVQGVGEDGFAFVPGVLDPATVAEMRERILAIEPSPAYGDWSIKAGRSIDHFKNMFNRDPFWLRFLDQPGLIDAVERLMGPACHIIGMSAWQSPPSPPAERERPVDPQAPLHADQIFIPLDEELLVSGRVRLPMFLGTLHFYLCDIDLDLCPTWVVPGSHLAGRGPTRDPLPVGHHGTIQGPERSWNGREQVPVLCQAGDCLLFRSELWHRGSVNRTPDRSRFMLQVHYGQRGIAQRLPPYLGFTYDQRVLALASPRQLRLLGKHEGSAYG